MGPLLILLAAVTWGTTGATMKLIDAGSPVSPLLVGFFRVAIAAPLLCVAGRSLGGPIRVADRGDRVRLLVAGLAMGAFQVFYFAGVAKTSVAVGSLVAICSAPIFITILAAALLGERIDVRTWAALGGGIAGAALLTIGPHGLRRLPPGFAGGVLLALGGGVS
ncbi:MAG: EamA family transporter, partial [Candidatus Rokuibacteriota bacterium]